MNFAQSITLTVAEFHRSAEHFHMPLILIYTCRMSYFADLYRCAISITLFLLVLVTSRLINWLYENNLNRLIIDSLG